MKLFIAATLISLVVMYGQPSGDPIIEGLRLVEVASVADAMEQLYGQRAHMSHEMRPLFTTKTARRPRRGCWMQSTPLPPDRST
jgi:hypothetical protein